MSQSQTHKPITRLPSHLVNQIAAGEVVERPASVLKELVENSLDAGATYIEVGLKEGGIEELEVIDNGSGIPEPELSLALERHTTNKIREASDLQGIVTYGFRGEALSAIASVSTLQLQSRTNDSNQGFLVTVAESTRTAPPRPVGAPVGTKVKVSKLFQWVPARQKYLRSAQTEAAHCSKIFREIAMSVPAAEFKLRSGDKIIRHYSAKDRLSRFRECFGPKWEPIHLVEENDGVRLEAFLSPADVLQDRGELFLFINGRVVRNRGFSAAVRNAYSMVLGPHHDPSGALYLDILPEWVDVNVHPQKWEVRCLKQESLYGWLTAAVRRMIGRASVRPIENHFVAEDSAFALLDAPAPTTPTPTSDRFLGTLPNGCQIMTTSDSLLIVDPQRLQSRLLLDKMLAERRSVPLEPPQVFSLGELNPILLAALHTTGFHLEPFGERDWLIKSIPEYTEPTQLKAILDTVTALSTDLDDDALVERIFATTSVYSVPRNSVPPGQSLFQQLPCDVTENWTCPEGKPILWRIPFGSIDSQLKRKTQFE